MAGEVVQWLSQENIDGSHTLIVVQADDVNTAVNLIVEELETRPDIPGGGHDIDEDGALERMIVETVRSIYPRA